MKMIHLLLVLALIVPFSHLLKFVAPLAMQAQTKCLGLIKSEIDNQEIHRAFFCGQSLNEGPLKQLWISTGLYHLLVVSGSHLIFLFALMGWTQGQLTWIFSSDFFQKNPSSKFGLTLAAHSIEIFLSCYFTLMTGFQAPLVRALFAKALQFMSRKLKLFWPRDIIVNISGIACLLLFPEWLQSQSLLLSWLASLALTQGRTALQKSISVFLITLPCLWGWGQINPMTILANIFISPLVSLLIVISGLFLLPASAMAEKTLKLSLWVLQTAKEIIPASQLSSPIHVVYVWSFLVLLTIAVHIYRIKTKRQQCTE